MKLDLDELERDMQGVLVSHPSDTFLWRIPQHTEHSRRVPPPVVLALIAHVRALHTALIRAAELTEGTVSTGSQHDCAEDDPDWQEAQRWRELVTKGAVVP
jgi:hypothetical protein